MIKAADIEVPTFEEAYQANCRKPVSCGYEAIGRSGFLRPGSVTMVFSHDWNARSMLAKNLIARMLLEDCSEESSGVLVFSPRVPAGRYIFSIATMLADVNGWLFDRQLLTKCQRAEHSSKYDDIVAKLKQAPLCIEDRQTPDPDWMVRVAKKVMGEGPLGLVVVDQLQDLDCGRPSDSQSGWSVIGSRLSRMAVELDVPVLVLSGCPQGESTYGRVFDGYGCLQEYVDRALLLTHESRDVDADQDTLLLRSIGGCDEYGVEIRMSCKSGRMRECLKWERIPVEPPPASPEGVQE